MKKLKQAMVLAVVMVLLLVGCAPSDGGGTTTTTGSFDVDTTTTTGSESGDVTDTTGTTGTTGTGETTTTGSESGSTGESQSTTGGSQATSDSVADNKTTTGSATSTTAKQNVTTTTKNNIGDMGSVTTVPSSSGGTVTTAPSDTTGGEDMAEQVSYDQTAASYRVWQFDGTADGFTAVGNGSSVKVAGSVLTFACGNNGYLASPSGLNVPAEAVRTVTLRIKSKQAKLLTLTWKRLDGKTDKVSINIEADGQWHDYQIDLAGVDSWKDTIDQLRFAVNAGLSVELDWVRLTGLYLVPFPWIGGDFSTAAYRLKEIKDTWSSPNNAVTVGYSALVQYMTDTDENGDYKAGYRSVDYWVKLAKAVDMPVMIWLRNDPWAEPYSGVAQELYAEDKNLMWTEELTASPAYRRDETGYFYFCLAQTDLNGNKTEYWKQTEKLLDQCAKEVKQAIMENPGYILGITTTSEYRYLTHEQKYILDYNPNTIKEFRDWSKEKYGTIAAFNAACGTSFTTWELRSTDYNPETVENQGGFDAPRDKYKPTAFWDVWGDFREHQLTVAEQKLVDIIRQSLDECYIYTHQIAYDDYTTASPISTGDAEGANVGIDFFNHEVTDKNLNAILDMIGNDVTRTWGVPEWLITHSIGADNTSKVLEAMLNANVKYLCPFNWGSNDMYDVQGSPSEGVIADYVERMESLVSNSLSAASVRATSGFANGTALIDGSAKTAFTTNAFVAGEWIAFNFGEKRTFGQVTLVPTSDGAYPAKISIQVDKNGTMETVGTYDLSKMAVDKAVTLRFDAVETTTIQITVDTPAQKDGKAYFALAEITAGE